MMYKDNMEVADLHKLLYSRKQAATILGVSVRTIARLIADDRLESVILGNRRLVTCNGLLNRASTNLY